ncbi:DUF2959 family protein [Humisphaera borealis]|uniref:DUF2959 family protein n=1 Tax=Humisphaera borealis TaxID=2807512 RepID=A0A7M2WY20_9BACT|nr:DUF2959 family protein [Humisphaera borealis]QOV90427.1 DUF2959 family protein [Humisphaera borealis]
MYTTKMFRIGSLGLTAGLLGVVAGCSSNQGSANSATMGDAQPASAISRRSTNGTIPGVDRTLEAVSSVRDLRTALTAERLQVDKTLVALTAVTNSQGDLIPAFQQYVQSLADLKAARQNSASSADAMRDKARGYITGWEVEVYGVEDQALRTQAERRRNEVRKDYAAVTDSLRTVQDAYEKFESKADDVRRFLANDLTGAGVQAAASAGQQTVTAGGEHKGRIDATVTTLDLVLGHMSPNGPNGPQNAQPTNGRSAAAPAAPQPAPVGVDADKGLNKP